MTNKLYSIRSLLDKFMHIDGKRQAKVIIYMPVEIEKIKLSGTIEEIELSLENYIKSNSEWHLARYKLIK